MYTTIYLVAVCSCYHGLAINSLYSILWTYHLPAILTSGAYFFCVLVPDYINARTILHHTWALSSESVIAHKWLQGRPYIRISSALQRKSHNYLCFHGSQILYVITVNIRICASEEYCGTLQWLKNWHQGIECHSGCNETHTLPTCRFSFRIWS